MQKIVFFDRISAYSQQLCRESNVHNAQLVFFQDDETLEQHLADAGILVTSTRGVTGEQLRKAKHCKLVQKLGTGVNNVDVEAAEALGIYVGNVAGANALSVAEYAVMLILASCRHVNIAHNRLAQEGKWEKSTLRDSCCELSGKTVGILGLGNIGQKVTQLLRGFSCRVLYHDLRRLDEASEARLAVRYEEVDEICREADVISLHLPLTEETRYIIDARRLALMKDTAVVVNTGRGGLIHEGALLEALTAGKLLGVALDTHEQEPTNRDNPLMAFERVIFSPHTAAGTRESMQRVIGQAFENINSLLGDGTVSNWSNIVNRGQREGSAK